MPETNDALKEKIREAIGEIQVHIIDNVFKNWTDRVGQPRQPFECNYFPLLSGRIVLSNKKRNFRKYSAVFFKHFPKKGIWRTLNLNLFIRILNVCKRHFSGLPFTYPVLFITKPHAWETHCTWKYDANDFYKHYDGGAESL